MLSIDPQPYLYPFIQEWPVPSRSAETLLIRRDGDNVIFLNPLRAQADAALNLRYPLDQTQLPSVKAVLGEEGIVEGTDYRGEAVIADIRKVPESPWFLVSKMDTAEVYAPLRERLWLTVFFFGALVMMAGAGLLQIWRQQRVRYYKAQAEISEALRASEEKFRLAFDTSPDAVTISQLENGVFVSVNKGFEHKSGYSREEVLGKSSLEIPIWKNPEDRRRLVEVLRTKGEIQNYEAVLQTRNGEISVLISASIITFNNKPHILNITHDISDRKQAETALRESEDKFKYIFDYSMIGKSITQPDGKVSVNQAFCEMLGYSAEELKNKKWQELTHLDDIEMTQNFFDLLLSGEKESARFIKRYLHKNGATVWTDVSSSVRRGQDGKPLYFITSISDITEQKKSEKQLLKTLEELKRSNTELEQFAYVASHDLQEPLRAVAGMVQLLQKRYQGKLDDRADEYITLAMDGANRMQTLITDLLEYSRVDRRGNPIQPIDANVALKSALRNLEASIQQSGAIVTTGTLPTVDADATQLAQLFQNLIGNAIKFRSERPPQIHVAVKDLGDVWQFSIRDNGIGIESQYFERIFLVFQRLHTRREYPGTGIGLSICKKIIERHGGRIWIESQPGQGTTFYFTIPHRS